MGVHIPEISYVILQVRTVRKYPYVLQCKARIPVFSQHALSVSVGNRYSEDQLMHTFLDNCHQGGKYSSHIDSHQAELRREEKITDQKSLNISSLQTDYLNLDTSSGFGRNS